MSKFKIEILRNEEVYESQWEAGPCVRGQITIGKFDDRFDMPLSIWSIQDYKRQWAEAIERFKTEKVYAQTCLVTEVERGSINMWGLYKRRSKVFIVNYLICAESYTKSAKKFSKFSRKTCYEWLPKLRRGKHFSLWEIDYKDIFE